MKYMVNLEFNNGHKAEFITVDDARKQKYVRIIDGCEFFCSREGHVVNLDRVKHLKVKRFNKTCGECRAAKASWIEEGAVYCDECMREKAMKKE